MCYRLWGTAFFSPGISHFEFRILGNGTALERAVIDDEPAQVNRPQNRLTDDQCRTNDYDWSCCYEQWLADSPVICNAAAPGGRTHPAVAVPWTTRESDA